MNILYQEIFKRKSFHFFVGGEKTTDEDLKLVSAFINIVEPLYPDIKTAIKIVPENETTCHRGADYCILFYSETKGDYLRNIGYIGEQIDIANIVRFTHSACNTQPWFVENKENTLSIYRYKKPGKRGIMPLNKVMFYNQIDIGIFLYILETCLKQKGIKYQRELMPDLNDSEVEKTLAANYKIQ